jgi:hypothetical protein
MLSEITVLPDALHLAGHDLVLLRTESDLRALLGDPERHEDIRMHPSGIRRRLVWDARGIVAHADYPEDRLSHLHFAFVAPDTPGTPTSAMEGVVVVNGKTVDGTTTEARFPLLGPTPFTESQHCFIYEGALYTVDFTFRKPRNRIGKRSGAYRLAFVSLSWRGKTANQALQTTPMTRSEI